MYDDLKQITQTPQPQTQQIPDGIYERAFVTESGTYTHLQYHRAGGECVSVTQKKFDNVHDYKQWINKTNRKIQL